MNVGVGRGSAPRPSLHGAFRDIVEMVPDAAVVVDPSGIIRLTNRAAESLFRYGPEQLIGQRLDVLIPERFRSAHRSQFEAYLLAPRARPLRAGFDLRGLRSDGTEIALDISIAPLVTAEGPFVAAWIRDATERTLFLRALQEERIVVASERDAEILRRTVAEESVRRSHTRLSLLHDVDRAILRATSPDGIARVVTTRIRAMVACKSVSIVSFGADPDSVSLLATEPVDRALRLPAVFAAGILGEVQTTLDQLRQGRVCEVDLATLPGRSPRAEVLLTRAMRHFTLVPSIAIDRLVGVLIFEVPASGGLSAGDREIALEVGSQLAIALQEAEDRRQLAEVKRELQDLFDRVPVGLIRTDPDGRIRTANPAFAEMFRFADVESARSETLAAFYADPNDRQRLLALDGPGDVRRFQARFRRKDGEILWGEIEARIVRDPIGRPMVLEGVIGDVTARKRAEDELRDRARLAQFAAEIGAALTEIEELARMLQRCAEIMVDRLGAAFARIWTLDDGGDVLELRASAGMYTHLDGPHGRVPVGTLKIGRIAAERRPHLTNAVVGDPAVSDQLWARREGMVAFAGYPLTIDQRVIGVVAMFSKQPLSESTLDGLASVARILALAIDHRRAAEELRESLRRAEQADRLKTAFLSNVRHEMRTPLNVIIGFSDLLLDELSAEQRERVRPMLEAVQASSERLLRTVEEVLDAAALQAGTYVRSPEPIDLGRLLEAKLAKASAEARRKGLDVRVDLRERVVLEGDEHAMSSVLHHVIDNAIKFTNQGAIAVRLLRDPRGAPVVEVEDTGIGMSAAFLERVFRPFSQQDEGLQRRFEGAGVGLALCKRFLALEGAEIGIESTEGVGTIVRLQFDRAREVAGEATASPGAFPAEPPARSTVVAVTAEAGAQSALRSVLGDAYEVVVVPGPERLRETLAAREGRVDAIVIEVSAAAPQDALSVVAALRRAAPHRTLPIIAAVEGASDLMRARCMAAGCDACLATPISGRALREALEAVGVAARSGA